VSPSDGSYAPTESVELGSFLPHGLGADGWFPMDDLFPEQTVRKTGRHVISALVQNQPGVLAHIAGMLASRGFNIDSLAVGETENPELSRMTFVVFGDDRTLDQVRKQLEKIVTVVRVQDISSEDYVERDLMLIRVTCPPERRSEICELVGIFRGKVVDVGRTDLMIEISGTEKKVEAFIELMRPYGIKELVRSGRIALVRSSSQRSSGSESHTP